jgi:flagellar basal-body rod protein FlgG
MNRSMVASAVSMQALQHKLDIISNNVANNDTLGFKKRNASFIDVLNSIQQQPAGFQREGRLTPPGLAVGWGARIGLVQTDLSQGSLKATDNPLDLALQGDAVFEVEVRTTDAGGNPVVQPAWTRDGAFLLSVNPADPGFNYLTTKSGNYVRGVDDQPIRIPADHDFKIGPDGSITAYDKIDPSAPPLQLGRLKIMNVTLPQALEQTGNNLYILPAGSNFNLNDVLQPVAVNAAANSVENVTVRQGFLEQSNVDLSEEMSELLMVQRAYQLNARAVQSSDMMMNMTNNLRG